VNGYTRQVISGARQLFAFESPKGMPALSFLKQGVSPRTRSGLHSLGRRDSAVLWRGLMYGRNTHISVVEYWRWWVVHLWFEGFFEVFATTVIAFLFARLKLIRPKLAAEASLAAATIYLAGGIIGTNHHLYFSGTPTAVLAWGATVSALEVVPLVLIGYQAMKDLRLSRSAQWVSKYKWPVYFFIAVVFWNLVGAGLFGFMINPPIALYYMQGLNMTAVHAHGALFGVYGMLGLGLTVMCLRALMADREWKKGLLKFSFWSMNIGLALMILLSLLPVGLLQTWASVKEGYRYAWESGVHGNPADGDASVASNAW
jgi:nitric oxide reductase subunit B